MTVFTAQDYADLRDYGYIRADEPEVTDPEILSLAETPEGLEMERDTLWQQMEDLRAQEAADLYWRIHRQSQQAA